MSISGNGQLVTICPDLSSSIPFPPCQSSSGTTLSGRSATARITRPAWSARMVPARLPCRQGEVSPSAHQPGSRPAAGKRPSDAVRPNSETRTWQGQHLSSMSADLQRCRITCQSASNQARSGGGMATATCTANWRVRSKSLAALNVPPDGSGGAATCPRSWRPTLAWPSGALGNLGP